MIFPLPLAPFEEYMLVDDRPAYPMNFFLRLWFDGVLDRAALDDACQQSVTQHPLLSARVQAGRGDHFQWVQDLQQSFAVHWRESSDCAERIEAIDLQREPGLRVWATEADGRTELLLQFHHSCCDAIGACQFIDDLLVCYADLQQANESRARPRCVDVERLLSRASYGVTGWQLARIANKRSVGLLRARKFLMRKAVPVKPVAGGLPAESLPADFPSSCEHEFDNQQTTRLRAGARQVGTTANNLLVRDLFLALEAFRSRRQLNSEQDWLRLAVPINMRLSGDERLPAANMVSMVFLDRHPQDCADPQALLQSVHDEMQMVKDRRLGLTFLLSLRYNRKLPGAVGRVRRRTEKAHCQGTGVISNLVSPWETSELRREDGKLVMGDVVLQRADFLPPLRPYTSVALGAVTYAGRLCLALHYDARVLNREEADELLEKFVGCLEQSMARP
ncbi:MAG: condensation domain-containing protein [Planctomycetota bacterium]|nr:condensation domain-containing protein [Planctomycetota bacterium]